MLSVRDQTLREQLAVSFRLLFAVSGGCAKEQRLSTRLSTFFGSARYPPSRPTGACNISADVSGFLWNATGENSLAASGALPSLSPGWQLPLADFR